LTTSNSHTTKRLSSNWTMVFALFLPTFWIAFFGIFSVAMATVAEEYLPFPGVPYFRQLFILSTVVFFFIIRMTFMRLKRAEASETHLFVTNYFKTYRYPIEEIENTQISNWGLFKLLKIELRYKGKFGKKIIILPNKNEVPDFLQKLQSNKQNSSPEK